MAGEARLRGLQRGLQHFVYVGRSQLFVAQSRRQPQRVNVADAVAPPDGDLAQQPIQRVAHPFDGLRRRGVQVGQSDAAQLSQDLGEQLLTAAEIVSQSRRADFGRGCHLAKAELSAAWLEQGRSQPLHKGLPLLRIIRVATTDRTTHQYQFVNFPA